MRRTIPVLALLTASLVVPGCGSSDTIRVTGKLLKGGVAYTPPEGQKLNVTLYAMEVKDASGKALPAGEPYAAMLNPKDGTFTVPGSDGGGIPPGKYRVSVVQRLSNEALANMPKSKPGRKGLDRETDLFHDQFGPDTSPILKEITTSGEIVVDLGKAEATTEPPKADPRPTARFSTD